MQGTQITPENTADVLEIQRIADAMSNALDAKDWVLVRSFTTETVETSIGPDDVVAVPADEMVAGFERGLSSEEIATQHMRTNQRIHFISEDEAVMYSTGLVVARTHPGGDYAADGGSLLVENWIRYEQGLVRTPDGWKINRIQSEYFATKTTSLPGQD